MRFHIDVHLHSHFSRATSRMLNLEHLSKWAQLKGIRVVGTGDFVHPAWMTELQEKLEPAEEGLFALKPAYANATRDEVPAACRAPVRFMLTVEISNIYKRLGRVRKVHNVLFAPGFEAAETIQAKLDAIGNIRADGRPILGLDSRDLLEITLEADPLAFLIPAHIWTPWFSALGSKGGFDRMEDCFGDLTPHIFAVETGLSSDPPMNWRLSQLDPYVLVSNSDAHSPPKLGRETTMFDAEPSYPAIHRALADPDDPGLVGTVEFFPEEGKYHYDGHRKCGTRLHPRDTIENGGACPVCGKPVTVGVMARVEALSDRPDGARSRRWRPYHRLIPLPEIIGAAKDVGPASKTVDGVFQAMLAKLGNELHVLLDAPIEDIRAVAGTLVAEGVRRVRNGEVDIAPGYDGEYGTIGLFSPEDRASLHGQTNFLEAPGAPPSRARPTPPPRPAPVPPSAAHETESSASDTDKPARNTGDDPLLTGLNAAQRQAVTQTEGHLLIVAGPGAGKTHTLTRRIAYLARRTGAPRHILAVTFTHKAADEMRDRLAHLTGDATRQIIVGTFHAVCLSMLRTWGDGAGLTLATRGDLDRLARHIWPEDTAAQRRVRLDDIARWKTTGQTENPPEDVATYNRFLRERGLLDFDDVILETLALLRSNLVIRRHIQDTCRYIFVDEYQDVNAAQHALLRALVEEHVRITAIGDPNQAIYGFRGAEPRFFETFARDFPGAAVLYLSANYRSAPPLVSASTQMMGDRGVAGVPPPVAQLHMEGRLTLYEAPTDRAEAEYVVHQIERLIGGTSLFSRDSGRVGNEADTARSFGDIGVLYRLNSQHAALEEALHRSGIPYRVSGHRPLIEQPGVRTFITILQLSHGVPVTVDAAEALLTEAAEGIGEKTTARIGRTWDHRPQVSLDHIRALSGKARVLPGRARPGLRRLLEDIDATSARLRDAGIHAALAHFSACPTGRAMLEAHAGMEERFHTLTRCARLHPEVTTYIDHLLLSREYDAFGEASERVSLMTLHAAKGLEFAVVFIVGCEHDLIPLQYPGLESDPDEERRLFYVGMTRARERLYLVRAKRRSLFGSAYRTYPSPFLSDIEESLKHYEHAAQAPRRKKAPPPSGQFDLFGG